MKTIKAEILMIEGAPFPVIKEIYDPSNESVMGIITPEAPHCYHRSQSGYVDMGKYQSISCLFRQ